MLIHDGLLEEFTKQHGLTQTMRNRTTTPEFSFFVNSSRIRVNHAQIEIDACYENLNQIIIFEAKIGIPSSFNIRRALLSVIENTPICAVRVLRIKCYARWLMPWRF